MASVARWTSVEPHGLDISPELAALARTRYPQWAERIVVGNALGFRPDRRFDFVRTGLEYVPPPRRCELVSWLVAPGGRLIVGKYNKERDERRTEAELDGFAIAGRAQRLHRHDPRIYYRVLWIDSA